MKKILTLISILVLFLLFLDFSCQWDIQKTIPVTNDFSFTIGSNDYIVLHGDINGYNTISNLIDYRYCVLTNGNYDLVVNDTETNLVLSSNFIGSNVITNYYWTNVLLTNNDGHHLVTNGDFVNLYRGIISDNDNRGYYNDGAFYCNLTNDNLTLWDNGNVSNGILGSNHTLSGFTYNKGDRIRFAQNGNLADFLTAERWHEVTVAGTHWLARNYHQSFIYDNKMWVLGGYDGSSTKNDIWYSSDGTNWYEVTVTGTHWSARDSHQAFVYNDHMWVLGGKDSNYTNDIWYSSDGTNWYEVTVTGMHWSGRSVHQSFIYDNKMWVLGGYDGSSAKNDIWYSSDGTNWYEVTVTGTHWSARDAHQSFIYNDKMWVIGGLAGSVEENDIWYSSDGTNWHEVTVSGTHWSARNYHQSFVYNDHMWVFGGFEYDGSYTFYNDIWYSSNGRNWNQVTVSGTHWSIRYGHQSFIYNDQMWILGGGDANDIWVSE